MTRKVYIEARQGLVCVVSVTAQPFARKVRNEAATVAVYVSYADEPPGNGKEIGRVAPGQTLDVEHNPAEDRDLRAMVRSLDARGRADADQLRDAQSVILPINRETAPILNQRTDATHTEVELGIVTSPRSKTLRVQTSPYSDFGEALEIAPEETIQEVPPNGVNSIPITRTSASSSALTIYIRAATAAGGKYGDWSDTQTVTFANLAGSGGSGGTGGFGPGTRVEIEHEEL